MSIDIFTANGMTSADKALFTLARPLIAYTYALHLAFPAEAGYVYSADSSVGDLPVENFLILCSPLTANDIDENNLYIHIGSKILEDGTIYTTDKPIIRRLYYGIDWSFGTGNYLNMINIYISPVGPNADIKNIVGTGDMIAITPTKRCMIPVEGNIGTTSTGIEELWVARNDSYIYDYIQIFGRDTFNLPPLIFEFNCQVGVLDEGDNTTSNPDTKTVSFNMVTHNEVYTTTFANNAARYSLVYWGGVRYSTVLASSYDGNGLITLILSRVPTNVGLRAGPASFAVRANDSYSGDTVTFSFFNLSQTCSNSGLSRQLAVTNGAALHVGLKIVGAGNALPSNTYISTINGNIVTMSNPSSEDISGATLSFKGSVSNGTLPNLKLANVLGYAVTHLARYIGLITGIGTNYITVGEPISFDGTVETYGESATLSRAATPELCEIIQVGDIEFATADNGPWYSLLDLAALDSDHEYRTIFVKGHQLIKSRPYVSPNYQLLVVALAFPT